MLHNVNKPAAITCAGCKSPSNCTIWEQPACFECHAHWIRDERFSVGAINDALGLSSDPESFTEAGHKAYVAEATKRTRAWLAERKTARAA
jgi:hypothetical protein